MISVAYAAGAGEHASFIESPETWLAFAFILLFVIVVAPFTRAFRIAMIVRGAKIKKQIIAAQTLRSDTEKLLQDYLQKQENVEKEINDIVDESKVKAEEIRKEAEETLKKNLVIREKQVLDNIALLETTALAEINSKITDITLKSVQHILEETIDGATDANLIKQFSKELPNALKNMN